MAALSISIAGITTITRCSLGMPAASARRGSRRGRIDSPITRCNSAMTACEAGQASSSSAGHAGSAPGPGPRLSMAATTAAVPAANVSRYSGSTSGCQARRAGHCQRVRPPSARASVSCPAPCSQWRATAPASSAPACRFIKPSSACATCISEQRRARARRSMPCSVSSWVVWCSAANSAEPSIRRINGLTRATIWGQSASPMARNAPTALLTLRLSAVCSAAWRASASAGLGKAACSHARTAAGARSPAPVVRSCRRCANWLRKTSSVPRRRICSSSSCSSAGVQLAMRP